MNAFSWMKIHRFNKKSLIAKNTAYTCELNMYATRSGDQLVLIALSTKGKTCEGRLPQA